MRLKQDIADVDPVSSSLMQLKVRSYNYKDRSGSKADGFNAKKSIGFIAQEIQQINGLADIMINHSPDKDVDGTPYLGVNQSVLIPYLVKGFQEQQAKIVSLETQLASLKAKVDTLTQP